MAANTKRGRAPIAVVTLLSVIVALAACDAPSARARMEGVGSGNDAFVNGFGKLVTLDQYSGRFVWIDYSAEWCAACVPQTRASKAVASSQPPDVVFITIMTSEPEAFGHPATQATAARWAERFGLDPARVLAADLSAMTLPRQALISPSGRVVFEETGSMSAAQIRHTLQSSR